MSRRTYITFKESRPRERKAGPDKKIPPTLDEDMATTWKPHCKWILEGQN